MAVSPSDRLEILQFLARYSQLVDAGERRAAGEPFTDDAVLERPDGTYEGRDTIAALPATAATLRHWLDNHLIEVDGDSAEVTSYGAVFSPDGPSIFATVMYRHELQPVDGA